MASDDDSYSSSSSSDDEFLTIGEGKAGASAQDREAMIRRKLLESFYGKTAVEEEEKDRPQQQPEQPKPQAKNNNEALDESKASMPRNESMPSSHSKQPNNDQTSAVAPSQNDDLDSPYFDAETHSTRLVLGSSVHTLLETEERLALEVRTLDSTMQTLVYENYSKFIDATDAIRSIGVSVQANDDGLAKLASGMHTIDEQTRSVEDALGGLRDAVAEKLRVKRLLTRLDALLKLPATLKQQIEAGNYRSAAKSFQSASSILSKHSAGFESLKSIETECQAILTDMVGVLKRKLVHWSGRKKNVNPDDDDLDFDDELGQDNVKRDDEDEVEDKGGGEDGTEDHEEGDEDWIPPPDPPEHVADIFECAGALVMLLPGTDGTKSSASFDSGLSASDCKSMALACSLRLLDRVLDSHHIELQERTFEMQRLADEKAFPVKRAGLQSRPAGNMQGSASGGIHLIPNEFLDSLLEAATLYGITFGKGDGLDNQDRTRLVDFVSETFDSFLSHVRSILLEQTATNDAEYDENGEKKMESEDNGDAAYLEVSQAMAHLQRSVRDVASGLALPEVGIDVEVASGLVDQTVEVTESLIRRRVSQKFYGLRLHMLRECLKPFAKDALAHTAESEGSPARVVQVVQMASVALSDAMQLVDDVVRSILSGGIILGATASAVDYAMVKQAVQTSANRFAMWLAATLEILGGSENSDPKLIIDAAAPSKEEDEEENEGVKGMKSPNVSGASKLDGMSDMSDQIELTELIESTLQQLVENLEDEATKAASYDFMLAIAEMCRLAERSVMENITHSIVSSSNETMGKKSKSSGIFQKIARSKLAQNGDGAKTVSERFKLAASRTLALYAMSRGGDAAAIACSGFYMMASLPGYGNGIPEAPRDAAWQTLEVVKQAALDCASVFGGEKRAGPVPVFSENDEYGVASPLKLSSISSSAYGGAIKGLQLDVERMFAEKRAVYPHPSRYLESTRTTVVTIALQIAFKAMMEQTRTCTFTRAGYRQLQVDVEFLRFMIPHFVGEDYKLEGANARTILDNLLNDVMLNAGQRCIDVECVGQEDFYDEANDTNRTPTSIVRDFMTPTVGESNEEEEEDKEDDGKETIISRFTIAEE